MENEQNIEDKIMTEITSGRVRLRSRYVFLAEKLSLGSALILSVLLAILCFCLVLFYLRATDNLVYLGFGEAGWLAFLESFPYVLVIGLIILIFISGFLIKKNDASYKKPFGYLAIGLVVIILAGGSALTYTSVADRFDWNTYNQPFAGAIFHPLFHRGLGERGHGLVGIIVKIDEKYTQVETPRGQTLVDVSHAEIFPGSQMEIDHLLLAVGERKGTIFVAKKIRILDEDEIPVIRRGIRHRFNLQSIVSEKN